MKNKVKIILCLLLICLGLGLTITSLIVNIKFVDANVVWQCLLGAGWTIASIFITIFGLIGVFNAIHNKEPLKKKKKYFNICGIQKTFKYKEKYLKLQDIKNFLLSTDYPEKIYVLSENDIYCSLEVYMESENPNEKICNYDLNSRQFFIDETEYTDLDEVINYLKNNKFVLKDGKICVIGYEHSSLYFL